MLAFFKKENLEIGMKLKIQAEEHGVRMGWFLWPVNFDPTWITNCEGFKKKEEKPCQTNTR